MQAVIIFLLVALARAAPQFQNQNSNPKLDPVNDAAAQDEIKKLQQKRTLFGQGPYAYGPTKHIGVHPLGFKYLLGYGPIGYVPYAKPITYLKPILRTQGWKQILPHFKPYFRRVKPHIVPVQHVEPHVHEVPQVQVQPVHIQPQVQQIQPHYQPIQPHFHQTQPHFHQVQPQVHAVQPVQKPLVQVPQQYYYPFYRPLNVPNTVVPQIQHLQPFVPQGVQHLVPQAPIYQQVPQHPLIHQVPVQHPVVHPVQPNFIHQIPVQHPVVQQVPVQHPVVQQVPVQHPVVQQVPVQHPVVHQVQPDLVHQVPNVQVSNFSPNLPLNPALYHLLKQFQHIPQFKHITPLYPVNYPEHQPPIQYPTTSNDAGVPLHLPEHPNIYPEQPQPPNQYPVTTNDAGISVQIPLHLPEHPNYRPHMFPDQSGSSDQDTTFPQPDYQQGHDGNTFLVNNPNVPTHPAPQTPLYLPPHPNFRPGGQNPGSVEAGRSIQTELSSTYPRQFPGNAGSAMQHPSITLEAPYGPGENLG